MKEIFNYEDNQIKLGNINNTPVVKRKFLEQLVELFCNKINKNNDLSFFYYELVDKWNKLLRKINNAKETLDIFECADYLFSNSEYYQMPLDNERKYIRINVDINDTVWLIVNNKPFNTANHIYITQKELEEL